MTEGSGMTGSGREAIERGPDARGLVMLSRFLADFDRPGFEAGAMVVSEASGFPYAAFAPATERFIEAAYEAGWILLDFDWPKWTKSEEAERLRGSPDALARADAVQLAKLLTACIREDRFCEGALLQDFRSGLIVRILRRARALADEAR